MKTVKIVSVGDLTGQTVKDQMSDIIGANGQVSYVLASKLTLEDVQSDVVVFLSEVGYEIGRKTIGQPFDYFISNRVIDHNKLEALIKLPKDTDVLLVNDSLHTALQAIDQLKILGLDHLNYTPYYPTCTTYPLLKTVITPGELNIVPAFASRIIDIGTRILDLKSIHSILSQLDIDYAAEVTLTEKYIRDIVKVSKSIEASRKEVANSEKMLSTIFDAVDTGMCILDCNHCILRINKKLEDIFISENLIETDYTDSSIFHLMPGVLDVINSRNGRMSQIGRHDYYINVKKIEEVLEDKYLVLVDSIDKIFKQESEVKKGYEEKLRTSLYKLDDYLTVHQSVKRMLTKAKKFAIADTTVLIQGENGTGKEILAQGMHMYSSRSERSFIPINIASISPTLLESELFGYTEGAFTGAQKGGKPGIFEIANGGTLFIDEIGDAPLDIQARLLRVLQEQRVRRIGAPEENLIDVRIIAATNKNLLDLVNQGSFRRDLFFRLNVLPIKTIPLRNRPDDITYLLNRFLKQRFKDNGVAIDHILSLEAVNLLNCYDWKGNVREIVNIADYCRYLYEGIPLEIDDLPDYLTYDNNMVDVVLLNNLDFRLLKWISQYHGIGRKKLYNLCVESALNVGEGKIRGILERFKTEGLITVGFEAKGCVITDKGITTLEKMVERV